MTTSPASIDEIDLSDLELFRRGFPHDVFTLLREQAPVWRHPDTPGTEEFGGGFWVVSTHADVLAVSRDYTRFSSREGPKIGEWPPDQVGNIIIAMDPPAHTRMRRLVNAGFTPRMVQRLEESTREWARVVVDDALEMGELDFVDEVAHKLPLHMISDIVGIPAEDREWYFGIVRAVVNASKPDLAIAPDQLAGTYGEMFAYGRELAERKRRSPDDDVWTRLTTVEVELDDGSTTRLTEGELDMFFLVLTGAGSETTRDSIAGGMAALLDHPDQLELLRRDPSVLDTAAEEIIRWVSSVTCFRRTATTDVVLHGAEIAAGDKVSLWYPSANRDAAVFTDPFTFDVTRSPNPHVAFGGPGVHHCLGAHLARSEIRAVFEELVARTSAIEKLGELVYNPAGLNSMISYSPSEFRVRLTAA